ncbi:YjbQ family protein [Flavobacterium alkalisoli]|uniref:YjbQ family protein n=1 Tax=Flavobacterium alkalisoli TaxID=2602769 RepID=A0A5B9FUB0_9FLAO|nr:YjbQ family protein [Flavobacterium alkalisoli]
MLQFFPVAYLTAVLTAVNVSSSIVVGIIMFFIMHKSYSLYIQNNSPNLRSDLKQY